MNRPADHGRPLVRAHALLLAALVVSACKQTPEWERGKKYLHYGMIGRVTTLEPVRVESEYSNIAQSQVYETLYTYEYLTQPLTPRPLLAAALPQVSENGRVYTIPLARGVRFQDDPCFVANGGRGREVVAKDVVYSLMRMADRALSPTGWWLFQDRIVGFDDFKARMDAREPGAPFDWDAPIAGLRATGSHTVRIELTRPYPQWINILAMTYTAVVPRECAEYYGQEFAQHPVGTGPFRLREWIRGVHLIYDRNPGYRGETYPSAASPELAKRGLLADAGRPIPFLDGLVIHVFDQAQPLWLKFRVGDIDLTDVPSEYQEALFKDGWQLRERFVREGMGSYALPVLEFIFHGFDMDDPLLGRGDKARYLRQAIALGIDTREINDAFYNSTNVLYDGPIPPGLAGHRPGVISPYRGPDIARAKELLARAGYPDGTGLPPLDYQTDRMSISMQETEMYARQLAAIGIALAPGHNSFPELSEKIMRRKAQIFRLSWIADYPDAENFLQLFYGPNETPGSNFFNYKNPAYDQLYRQAASMPESPERTALYEEMRDILIEDVPAFGSMARTRLYVWNRRVTNVLPSVMHFGWFKYLDVEAR